MGAQGADSDEDPVGDLSVRETLGDEAGDIEFALGERGEVASVVAGGRTPYAAIRRRVSSGAVRHSPAAAARIPSTIAERLASLRRRPDGSGLGGPVDVLILAERAEHQYARSVRADDLPGGLRVEVVTLSTTTPDRYSSLMTDGTLESLDCSRAGRPLGDPEDPR